MKKFFLFLSLIALGFAQAQLLNYTNLAPLPEARAGIDAAVYDNKIYIVNGFSTTNANNTVSYVYNISTNSYSTLSLPSSEVPGKRYANCEIINGKLYIFNGSNSAGINTKMEIIDLVTNNFSYGLDNPYAVRSAGSVVYNGDIYFFGGSNYNDNGYSDKLVKYSPSTNTYTLLANMPVAMETKGDLYNSNSIETFGGFNGSSLSQICNYNFTSNSWTTENYTVPGGISANGVVTDGRRVFLTGDYTNLVNNMIFESNGNARSITQSGMVGRRHHASVVVNGKVYIFGGNTDNTIGSAMTSAQVANLPAEIGGIGDFNGWGAPDLLLTTNDGVHYYFGHENTAYPYTLPATRFKFRQSQSWDVSWASNTFPTGIGTQNGDTIPVTEGNYYIYFNKTSGQYIFSTTALATNEIDDTLNKISFYPNPAKNKIAFTQELKSVEIYSTDGKKVSSHSNTKELNVSSLSKGIYLLQIITKNGTSIGKKLIKE